MVCSFRGVGLSSRQGAECDRRWDTTHPNARTLATSTLSVDLRRIENTVRRGLLQKPLSRWRLRRPQKRHLSMCISGVICIPSASCRIEGRRPYGRGNVSHIILRYWLCLLKRAIERAGSGAWCSGCCWSGRRRWEKQKLLVALVKSLQCRGLGSTTHDQSQGHRQASSA